MLNAYLKTWMSENKKPLQWLADGLNLSRHTVKKWGTIPPEYCVAIEKMTNGNVTRYQLRPDVFGD